MKSALFFSSKIKIKTLHTTIMSHYEFSAGPGIIAQSVLKEAQANLVDFHGAGRSIMEMSHRGAIVTKVANEAEADLRELLNVPDTHAILFAQGGATGQFSAIPLNLCGDDGNVSADFVVTGSWSAKASVEATKYLTANNVVEVKKSTGAYQSIPEQSTWKTSDNATYLHYTDNETVHGVEFVEPPTVAAGVELVADMSSNFLSRAVDVSKFGVIIAGAQKNCGIAGVTLVIIKKSLLGRHRKDIPIGLQYQQMEKSASMYNTPPVWAIYMAGLVFKWIKSQGGVDAMQKRAVERSSTLYDFIDNSDGFYVAPVAKNARSRMNIVFRIKGGDVELEKAFVAQADAVNLHTLKGHRSVGGLRASLYNAMPMEGVNALIAFMKEFQAKNN